MEKLVKYHFLKIDSESARDCSSLLLPVLPSVFWERLFQGFGPF